MFAQRVKERRKAAHMTQQELGDACGFGKTTVCSWEKGRFKPDVDTVERIAEVLGTTAGYLLGYTDDPTSGGGRGASTEPGACVEEELLAAYRAADPVFQAEAVEMLRRHPKT